MRPPADSGPPPSREEQRSNLLRFVLVIAVGVAIAVATGAFPAVVVVIAILLMIMLHETGHFATAKWTGMKVTEFFVGFGPRLWSVRRGETEYGVKAFPLGGYCRIIGMHNLEKVDPSDEPRAYRDQPFPQRLTVVLAGVVTHFVIAFVLLFVLTTAFGVPHLNRWDVGAVTRLGTGESPAQDAGLRLHDKVLSVDGHRVARWDDLRDYIRHRPGQTVTLVVVRGGRMLRVATTLAKRNPEGEHVGFLGIGPHFPLVPQGPVRAVGHSAHELGSLTILSGKALGSFFAPSSLRDYGHQLTGEPADQAERGAQNRFLSPVGAVRVASEAAHTGVPEVLELLILINVFVGIFNLVPLLPLDGGHAAIAVYERIRSRRGRPYHADVAKLLPLTYAVVMVLLAIGLTSLWLDIVKPIANPFQ